MIRVINTTPEYDKQQMDNTYHVYINNEFICRFHHDRPDGLAVCLRKAAEAVDEKRLSDARRIYDEVRGNIIEGLAKFSGVDLEEE